MSDIIKAILLGVVQGATEFLPISSSGHLIAAKEVFDFKAALSFDVALHVATLAAVLLYFCRYILELFKTPQWKAVAWRVLLGTLPAGAIGFAFRSWREDISPWFVVGGWLVSATYLILTAGRQGRSSTSEISKLRAILIGATQGIAAIFPGFSRSGASIASGLWLGLERKEAFRFSFLLAIPVMLGAGLVEGRELVGGGGGEIPGGWPALVLSMAAAFLVGLAAIYILFRAVVKNHFHRFGWYNLCAAVAFAIYLATR